MIAVPPSLLREISFSPTLPASHAALAEAWSGGNLIKLTATYPEPFWRDDDLSGEGVGTTGAVSITFDNSPPSGKPGALVGFVGGADAPGYTELPDAGRSDVALGTFARLFGPLALNAERVPRARLARRELRARRPRLEPGPGVLSQHGRALREPAGPLHFAATEYASRGAATWTARCARAKRPPQRSSDQP